MAPPNLLSTPAIGGLTEFRKHHIVFRMKTTLIIDDGVMKQLRQEAARRGTTISALVEAALRMLLYGPGRTPVRKLPPLPSFHGGRPLVEVADREALYRAMEGR